MKQTVATLPASNIKGYVNCTRDGSGEDIPFARNYYKNLNPKAVAFLYPDFPVLVTTAGNDPVNVWRYANPGKNNPLGYDLWLQLVINGKTNLICNWSKSVQINTADK